MITTIIFDLSEVYLGGMYGIEKKISEHTGIDVPHDFVVKQKVTGEFFHGKVTEEVFWKTLVDTNNWNINITTLQNLVRNQMVEIEGTREILEKLKENGYRMGLLSIHAKEWIDHVEEKFDFHKLFHSRTYSFEVGVSKPDPEAFRHILAKLGAKPSECIFIDDYHVNTTAAEKLGITTIVFKNAAQLKEDLLKMGIKLD